MSDNTHRKSPEFATGKKKLVRGKVTSVGAEGGFKRPVRSRRADDSGEGLLKRQKQTLKWLEGSA